MRISSVLLASLLTGSVAAAAQADAPPPIERTCENTHWELVTDDVRPGGAIVAGRARVDRRCHGEGRVSVQEFRYLAPDGAVVFRGATFILWNADRSEGDVVWLMVGDPGYSLLKAEWADGVLLQQGSGADAGGAYLEHSVTDFNGVGDSAFSLYRSYDAGESWFTPSTRATWYRSSTPPPDYASALAPPYADVALDADMTPFLDGYAAFAVLTDDQGAPNGVVFARPVTLEQPTWRTTTWRVDDAQISNVDTPTP